MEDSSTDLLNRIHGLSPLTWQGLVNWVDILLVAYLLFRIFKLIRGRQTLRIVIGASAFVGAFLISDWLHLGTLHYVLDKAVPLTPVALVILYLPELRTALEGFSRLGGWGNWPERLLTDERTFKIAVDDIVQAVGSMSEKRTGALLVFERVGQLDEVVATGTEVHARVSAALLEAIFYGENPLHDGAAVIRNDIVIAAACRLPLSESASLAKHMHMRHRAGLGVTEHADCVAVIVSEERGRVSVAYDGRLVEMANLQDLREKLLTALSKGSLAPKKRERKPAVKA